MGVVDQSLVFWDLAVEVAKRNGVDEVFGSSTPHRKPPYCDAWSIADVLANAGKTEEAEVCTNPEVPCSKDSFHIGFRGAGREPADKPQLPTANAATATHT